MLRSGGFMLMHRLILLSGLGAVASLNCFNDSVPEAERKLLVDGHDSFPVGQWLNNWVAGEVTALIAQILIQEKLGYVVEMKGPGNTYPDSIYSLMGCRSPTNVTDRQCDHVKRTYVHILVEAWTGGYPGFLGNVQQNYPETAPRNVGSMGYKGSGTMYIRESVKDNAYTREGTSLEYYREWDNTWKDPSRYFATPSIVNTSRLLPCAETALTNSAEMKVYVEATGDSDGIVPAGDGWHGKCFDGHFWYSPACRGNSSRCAVHITGGSGWAIAEQMQKATFHNMPLAIGIANSWSNYASLPEDYVTTFYWWEPDPTFLRLTPVKLVFPPYDRQGWARGDRGSGNVDADISKYVSKDLSALAPDVEELMTGYRLDLTDVNAMLLAQLDPEVTTFQAACTWLKEHEERWQSWLPDKTKCFEGFGLQDMDGNFVENRAIAGLTCTVCPAGYYSRQLDDYEKGLTHVCIPCASGTYQESAASLSCNPCPIGEYQEMLGSKSCKRCGLGLYQDERGQSNCMLCPAGTTTLGLGSLSAADCECREGTINVNVEVVNAKIQCQQCGEGLRCPFSSSIDTLLQGDASLGPEYTPELVLGYTSSAFKPLEIFKCVSNCPGGKPGVCDGGRQGLTCAECAAGKVWNGDACITCKAETAVLWIVVLIAALLALVASYYFVNSQQYPQASPAEAGVMGMGLAGFALQYLAIMGQMTARLPLSMLDTATGLSPIFLLQLDTLGLGCLSGFSDLARYGTVVAIFPGTTVWLFTIWAASSLFRWRWELHKTTNTAGVILQLGLATTAAVATRPLMCYVHPNGRRSVLSYPSTFCDEGSHTAMVAAGMALMGFLLLFAGACCFAVWQLPFWSANRMNNHAQAFRFLAGKFRLEHWWFGLVLLARNLGLSMAIALAVDHASLQRTIVMLIMLGYFGMVTRVSPWKVPMINMADAVVTCALVLLVSLAAQESSQQDQEFVNGFSLVTLLFVFSTLLALCALSAAALVRTALGRDGQQILSLSLWGRSRDLCTELQRTASRLLEFENLDEALDQFNIYDQQKIAQAITVLNVELFPRASQQTSFETRVRSMALSHRQSQLELIVNSQPPLREDVSEGRSEEGKDKEPSNQEDEGDHLDKQPESAEGEGNQICSSEERFRARTVSSLSLSGKQVVRDSL